ncbi:hypothetical protein [Chondromyces apiculatus]|uniref:VWA domain-containing protein n=1 Tax=Chondromyces apiculatus DSM 436 TaxID=1192034 RepID=A0A017SWQ5_9BACT|nr:hypothetical protein [Chondromyces apiculatus]EYF00756.1 Hypothetical protein CAP_9034 [Chondromyces apiculatus DSM 436]
MGFRFAKSGVSCAVGAVGVGVLALGGCLGGGAGGGGGEGGTGPSVTVSVGAGADDAGGPMPRATKVDLLLVVDNSQGMADKQEVLGQAMTDLVQSLTNPECVAKEEGGVVVAPSQPQTGTDPCPPGMVRRFMPVLDLHLGVLSSSIGGFGGDVCSTVGSPSNNDRGHLLARSAPDQEGDVPTYQSKGFLFWDPVAQGTPPGEMDREALVSTFSDMVLGVGQAGCGYEASLEGWYRFLADPAPYNQLVVTNSQAQPQGVDQVLLQQRAEFLRPDSMLVVLMLTDENDCSMREEGQYFLGATYGNNFHLPKARAVCATDPGDACCASCAQAVPAGCAVDPTCYVGGDPDQGPLITAAAEDHPNQRCFDQKRRFGIDFMYPTSRYVQALTSPTIADRQGNLVPNPIFSDLDPSDGNSTIRDPRLVILGGIVGVPWQEIARDPFDLGQGFKSAAELGASGAWDAILGDPESYVPPSSPYMQESSSPRAGVPVGNPINGGEWNPSPPNSDLQFACTFDLAVPRDCSDNGPGCDCGRGADIPVCDGQVQTAAKAYPGLRQLSVLQQLGERGVTSSICPAQLSDPATSDFGYRPAIQALVDLMATRLAN